MKQRVAVARTLANSPEVMLMDEPFAAVDAQTRMTLQEELGAHRRCGRSSRCVFVTHSVEEAIFLGDRVAVMTPGPGRIRAIVDVPFARADAHVVAPQRRSRVRRAARGAARPRAPRRARRGARAA